MKRVAWLAVLLALLVIGLLAAKPVPMRKSSLPSLPYNGDACPDGYAKGIAALRSSSPEHPLRLDDPVGNWEYVCIPDDVPATDDAPEGTVLAAR